MQCTGSCGSAGPVMHPETLRHPCYSFEGHKTFARMHIPVAPKCNIACNYCNRRYDCSNESRPGVTSEILSPEAALAKFLSVSEKMDNLSVVGIAGPGDALADWEKTKQSIELILEKSPDTVICLSTNGLLLPDLVEEIIALGVKHVTVTVNCTDPSIGAKIYRRITYRGISYSGEEGASLLWHNQRQGILKLTANGVLVKVNIVMMKGINERHIRHVVETVKGLGVFVTNIMPLIPAPGSAFAHHPQTSQKELDVMRAACELHLPQMRHCQQCRADAIGLLGEDRSAEFRSVTLSAAAAAPGEAASRPYTIAVATKSGTLVDTHFGHAEQFVIYSVGPEGISQLEKRDVEKYCLGVEECDEEETRRQPILASLADCDAVVSLRIGHSAKKRLQAIGILPLEHCDTIENALLSGLTQLAEGANEKTDNLPMPPAY